MDDAHVCNDVMKEILRVCSGSVRWRCSVTNKSMWKWCMERRRLVQHRKDMKKAFRDGDTLNILYSRDHILMSMKWLKQAVMSKDEAFVRFVIRVSRQLDLEAEWLFGSERDFRFQMNKHLNHGLMNACRTGSRRMIQQMIDAGADDWDYGLRGACKAGDHNIVSLTMQKGAKYFNWGLEEAAGNNHLGTVKLMFKWGATDVNTALNAACYGGHLEMAVLLGEACDPYEYSWDKALFHACASGNKKLIHYVVNKNKHVSDKCGHAFWQDGLDGSALNGSLNGIRRMGQHAGVSQETGYWTYLGGHDPVIAVISPFIKDYEEAACGAVRNGSHKLVNDVLKNEGVYGVQQLYIAYSIGDKILFNKFLSNTTPLLCFASVLYKRDYRLLTLLIKMFFSLPSLDIEEYQSSTSHFDTDALSVDSLTSFDVRTIDKHRFAEFYNIVLTIQCMCEDTLDDIEFSIKHGATNMKKLLHTMYLPEEIYDYFCAQNGYTPIEFDDNGTAYQP